jgi:hypothetical protein
MDAFQTMRAGRSERLVSDAWSLSVVPRGELFDAAVLRDGKYMSDHDSPIGGPWTFCTANRVAEIEAELRRAIEAP